MTNGWLPIESAPKDGTRVLMPYPLWDRGSTREKPDAYKVLIVRWNGVGWDSDQAWLLHEEPTHWQPLPEPPHE